jgi:methionine--tRNA ligase beta chain
LNELSLLEIRVGKILEVDVHPEAENLFVEKVDMGEPDGPRTIVSGLVQFCTKEQLLNKEVIVLANLKPRALKGITSAGMLLCASSADDTQVVPIDPPSGAELGALITFDGVAAKPADPGNRASKAYSKIAEQFKVNDDGVCCFKDMPFMTPQGPVTSTLKGSIS